MASSSFPPPSALPPPPLSSTLTSSASQLLFLSAILCVSTFFYARDAHALLTLATPSFVTVPLILFVHLLLSLLLSRLSARLDANKNNNNNLPTHPHRTPSPSSPRLLALLHCLSVLSTLHALRALGLNLVFFVQAIAEPAITSLFYFLVRRASPTARRNFLALASLLFATLFLILLLHPFLLPRNLTLPSLRRNHDVFAVLALLLASLTPSCCNFLLFSKFQPHSSSSSTSSRPLSATSAPGASSIRSRPKLISTIPSPSAAPAPSTHDTLYALLVSSSFPYSLALLILTLSLFPFPFPLSDSSSPTAFLSLLLRVALSLSAAHYTSAGLLVRLGIVPHALVSAVSNLVPLLPVVSITLLLVLLTVVAFLISTTGTSNSSISSSGNSNKARGPKHYQPPLLFVGVAVVLLAAVSVFTIRNHDRNRSWKMKIGYTQAQRMDRFSLVHKQLPQAIGYRYEHGQAQTHFALSRDTNDDDHRRRHHHRHVPITTTDTRSASNLQHKLEDSHSVLQQPLLTSSHALKPSSQSSLIHNKMSSHHSHPDDHNAPPRGSTSVFHILEHSYRQPSWSTSSLNLSLLLTSPNSSTFTPPSNLPASGFVDTPWQYAATARLTTFTPSNTRTCGIDVSAESCIARALAFVQVTNSNQQHRSIPSVVVHEPLPEYLGAQYVSYIDRVREFARDEHVHRVIVAGIGVPIRNLSTTTLELDAQVKAAVRKLDGLPVDLLVRGNDTKAMLSRAGYSTQHVHVVGCPTLFLSDDVHLGATWANRLRRIIVGNNTKHKLKPLHILFSMRAFKGYFSVVRALLLAAASAENHISVSFAAQTAWDIRNLQRILSSTSTSAVNNNNQSSSPHSSVFVPATPEQWTAALGGVDLVLAGRLQVALIAAANGVAAIAIASDGSALETARTMKVPHVLPHDKVLVDIATGTGIGVREKLSRVVKKALAEMHGMDERRCEIAKIYDGVYGNVSMEVMPHVKSIGQIC